MNNAFQSWLLRGVVLVLVLSLVVVVSGCSNKGSDSSSSSTTKKKTVYAVNYPLAYFAERIAGGRVNVHFPAPADVDPDYWQPDESVVQDYQNADLILLNGSNYAAWTKVVSLPDSRVVDTSKPFRDKYLTVAEAVVHKHGPEGEHAHEGLATLTWLDPHQAMQQAAAIHAAMMELEPDAKETFFEGWARLDRDLAEIENDIRGLPQPADSLMLASHPVYDYLGRYCGWNLKSMHWEPDENPSDEEWQKFAELHKAHPAKLMLWEAPPLKDISQRLESEFQVRCVAYYPCGNRPESGDYLTVMRQNVNRLRASLESSAALE